MIHIACIDHDGRSRFAFEQMAVLLGARGLENRLCLYVSPADALRHLPYDRPDIVFIDIRAHTARAPSALGLVRALRSHPLCQDMILVGMADYPMPSDQKAALAAGCNDFVKKPPLYQAIEHIIITHRAATDAEA